MKLVVIPSDPISAYELKGLVNLEEYYNPGMLFEEVFLLSPLETEAKSSYGMHIIPVKNGTEFRQKLGEIQPDVVRAYGGYWASLFAVRYCPENIPLITSIHDTDPLLLYGSVRYADRVVCMTNAVARTVEPRGVSTNQIDILPNRVSLDVFSPDASHTGEWTFLNNKRYLLHIGRRTTQKNLELVIHSLASLPNDLNLVSIGSGSTRPYLSLARQLSVEDQLVFIESIPNDQLPAFYANCEVFVCPSRWEGFGVVIIEAAACGAKIVCSGIDVFREVLQDGKNALMIDDLNNPEQLTTKILAAGQKPELQINALKLAKQFDRQSVNEQEIAIYLNVISQGSNNHRPGSLVSLSLIVEAIIKRILLKIRRLGNHLKVKK